MISFVRFVESSKKMCPKNRVHVPKNLEKEKRMRWRFEDIEHNSSSRTSLTREKKPHWPITIAITMIGGTIFPLSLSLSFCFFLLNWIFFIQRFSSTFLFLLIFYDLVVLVRPDGAHKPRATMTNGVASAGTGSAWNRPIEPWTLFFCTLRTRHASNASRRGKK